VNAVRNGRGIYHPSQERGHAVEVISSNALIFKEIGIVMMQFLKKDVESIFNEILSQTNSAQEFVFNRC